MLIAPASDTPKITKEYDSANAHFRTSIKLRKTEQDLESQLTIKVIAHTLQDTHHTEINEAQLAKMIINLNRKSNTFSPIFRPY